MSVGAAILAGASIVGSQPVAIAPADTAANNATPAPDSPGAKEEAPVLTASDYRPAVSEPVPSGWTKANAKKMQTLAARRALGTATADENRQFRSLQVQRRAAEVVSPDEMIAEWHRRRFISEVLEVLSRNVRFFKAEDQARFTALR